MAFRFINLQNLINSHQKNSLSVGLDTSIKLWKILKHCKKVNVYFFRETNYIKSKKYLIMPDLEFQ